MQKLLLSTVLVTVFFTGCVYKVDIPQGTPLTHAQASQIKVGMTTQQVRFILGTPTIKDPLTPLQWDYIYDYKPGTYAKKKKIPSAKGQHLKIIFNEQGLVSEIQGLDTLPDSQPGLPGSKDAILTAPRL